MPPRTQSFPTTFPVLGLPMAVTNYADAAQRALDAARTLSAPVAVAAANTHLTTLARHDPAFGQAMTKFEMICPDGMPLVWVMNRGLPPEQALSDRVYGPTLMLETLKASAGAGDIRHFLLGGKQSTLETLQASLPQRFPGLNLCGAYSPPFGPWDEAEYQRIDAAIRASGANVVWVGLGCPKQEFWIAENKHRLPSAVYFAVGAAFAFHAGEVSQAPKWIQDRGFEWLYRLCAEPRRLFKRYFTYNSLFLYYLLRDSIRPVGALPKSS